MSDEAALSFPILLTLRVCVACVLLYLCVGLPCARFCSRRRGLLARALAFLVTLPLIFPPVAMGFLLLLLLGRNGPIGGPLERWLGLRIVFSEPGVILSAFVARLPLVVRPLQAAMERPELRRLEEAARTLGCGTMGTFLFVTVPQVSRTLFSCLLLGVARASGEVGITMMLGGNISGRTNTLSLEIFNCVSRGDFDGAMRLCAVLAVVGTLLYALLEGCRARGGGGF